MDGYNGLTFNKVLIPEEIVTHILSHLDPPQLLKCRLVCKRWDEIVTSINLWCLIHERKYHTRPKVLPWHLYYHLFNGLFNTNLLKNVNGEQEFKHWNFRSLFGNRFVVEKSHDRSDAFPENVPEFNNNTSYFTNSDELCSKSQMVCFKESELNVLRKYKPHIYVSEWVAPAYIAYSEYICRLDIVCEDGKRIQAGKLEHTFEKHSEQKWIKLEMIITDYPDNIKSLKFTHGALSYGSDSYYGGPKMAGAAVKLLFESFTLEHNT